VIKPEILSEAVTLYEGDCLDVLPTLTGVDAVVTDPPYGVELGVKNDQRRGGSHLGKRAYENFEDTYEMFVDLIVPRLNLSLDIAKRGAVFSGPNIHEQRKPNAIGGIYCPCAVGRTSWGFKTFLPILFYGTAPDLQNGHKHTVLRSTESSEKSVHPCPKPIGWMKWLVSLASSQHETILDPFAGSGTTGVAAILEGRRAILIEKDPRYCEIIRRRIAEAESTGPQSLFKNVDRRSLFSKDEQ